ncbi:calbindin-32-like [Paramacrobiotus metropolitanus]|uniref:calbindin-32-like n=1 Tax=Paramacrobiotus metropolitanus TaxID=2943436 RepID=UPI002445A7B5|nr:calbindin-32-like [Paramacrobiotus metropolitanus]
MPSTFRGAEELLRKDSKRKGIKTRNFIDSKLQKHHGEVKPLTADKFLDIWKHYDADASRFLEKEEIRRFLKDFMNSALLSSASPQNVTETEADQLYELFMEEFDENKDGVISIRELTAVLPVEESFFALFRTVNPPESGIDYMKIWKKYDVDGSGYIESDELRNFLRDLLARAKPPVKVDEKTLEEYSKELMTLFDVNNDGKLGLQELIRLLPAQQNFVKLTLDHAHSLKRLNQSDINKLLDRYDKDGNGTLEGTELSNLVRDILEDQVAFTGAKYDARDVYEIEQALLKGCDVDGNGRIDRKELAVILLAITRSGLGGLYAEAGKVAQEIGTHSKK